MTASSAPLILCRNIEKSFGGAKALGGVSLEIAVGEVHGLVGANGAGKSTLIRTLAGLIRPDRGDIEVDGQRVELLTPQRATDLGMNFIHQELAFVPGMTVLQNIMLGIHKAQRLGLVDWRAVERQVAPIAKRVGITAPLHARAKGLSAAENWAHQHLPRVGSQGAAYRHGRTDRFALLHRKRETLLDHP